MSNKLINRAYQKEDGKISSIAIEAEFWDVLESLADDSGKSWAALVREIAEGNPVNVASAVRVYCLVQAARM